MAKRNQKVHSIRKKAAPGAWSRVLLAMTLVPMVIGVLLILAWGLDLNIWEPPESQVWVGIIFILLSFSASNVLQRKWYLAAGWFLLGVADFIFLRWIAIGFQIIAGGMAVIGVSLLLFEFYRQWRRQRSRGKQ